MSNYHALPAASAELKARYRRVRTAALLMPAEAAEFRVMEEAFRSSGGFVSADEAVTLIGKRTDQPISRLARWIVDRSVISLHWQGRTMLPLFQFDPQFMTLDACVTAVIRELVPALSDWEAGLWFAEPNPWLGGVRPVEALARSAVAVIDAARAERYLARG